MITKKNNTLTDSEKLAITYGVFNGLKSWPEMYLLSGRGGSLTPSGLSDAASRWKHSEQVEKFYNECIARDSVRIEMAADKKIEELVKRGELIRAERGKGTTIRATAQKGNETAPVGVDFTNPEAFVRFANQQANLLTDEKDRREYLKMIADLLRFKESESGKDREIRRFYTPLLCRECPLYAKETKK